MKTTRQSARRRVVSDGNDGLEPDPNAERVGRSAEVSRVERRGVERRGTGKLMPHPRASLQKLTVPDAEGASNRGASRSNQSA